jgi:hypothetical protein
MRIATPAPIPTQSQKLVPPYDLDYPIAKKI